MCESTAYLVKGKRKEEFMKDVARIEVRKGSFLLRDILGDTKELKKAVLKEINLMGHEIVFEAVG
ncbi:MAG: CooT family nickel-binding protein [Euryarchaeota archaeon]|nr:CooT family nickel-binding protein [Euryarchaeota archaeon]